jgi:sugar transferase EpsL
MSSATSEMCSGRNLPGCKREIEVALKRLIDINGSAILLCLTSPILFVAISLIRLKLGAPVLFRQERGGYRGEVFMLYKLRTMTDERDEYGELLPPGSRSTPFGDLLRRLSVDELPQLWNVLKGDMSLIGPRPLLGSYLPRYNLFQRRRHEMRPGLTGWAQVSGRNALTWEDKFALDVWYIDNWSLLLDLRIVLRTFWTICSGRGVSDVGTPAEYEFAGSPETVQGLATISHSRSAG